jgi:hypothetical protein
MTQAISWALSHGWAEELAYGQVGLTARGVAALSPLVAALLLLAFALEGGAL